MKTRSQNPVVGDEVLLGLFTYNSNNRQDFYSIDKVEIYYIDENFKSLDEPTGKRLVQTIDGSDVTKVDTGEYNVTVTLQDTLYVIGHYIDVWHVIVQDGDAPEKVINNWEIYPNLWFTTPIPIVYDFNFSFRPNKIKLGSKRYLIIDIAPNVPKATDLARFYENLAIVSPLTISIEQACGDCLPAEEDLRLIVDKDSVELREKCVGYYFLDTTEMSEGIYDLTFQLQFGESYYISDTQQLQIYS